MESERTILTPLDGPNNGGQRARPLHGRTTGPTRRSTKGQWTAEEDEILRKAVERFKGKNWKKIAECFKDRTDVQCLHRWQKVLNPELVKGPWSKEEDAIIVELVKKYGPKKWSTIAQHLPGRIGKQCRERWHNHLNPSINKEAWTQDEELQLIRAHQIYGNKWAELTKFLPGRTDNAIKNHWNSSVKKKLDSYIASGLLAQFPALPPAGYQSQFVPSSSRMQSSGDDTALKGGTEPEEISDCSQSSAIIGCSQSADDMGLQGREDLQLLEDPAFVKEQNSSPASCSNRYYSAMEEVTLSVPDIHPETGCSSDLPMHFSCEDGTCRDQNYQFNSDDLPHISLLELAQGSSGFPTQGANESHDNVNIPFQSSLGALVASSAGTLAIDTDQLHHILISDEECCRILFSETVNDGGFPSSDLTKESDKSDFGGRTGVSLSQSSNIHMPESLRALEPYDHSRLEVLGETVHQTFMSSPLLSYKEGKVNSARKTNHLPDVAVANQEDFVRCAHDGFIYTNDLANSPCDENTIGTVELLDLPADQSRLVSVDSLHSAASSLQVCSFEEPNVKMEKQESGSLCYEPPRFPSLDVPFLSCELIQSSNDMQMDYSPLGIRQLMMSSMNCISPFRLWDSPSHDSSPEGVLKSAAKTFTNPPSILRKRNRDLLSPLSDRRMDKKLEMDIASNLSRDFSRLDVVVDESVAGTASLPSPSSNQKMNSAVLVEDKENISDNSEGGRGKEKLIAVSDRRHVDKNYHSGSNAKLDRGTTNTNPKVNYGCRDDASSESMQQQTPEVLSEHDLNDFLLFSPTQPSEKTDKLPLAAAPNHIVAPVSSSGNLLPPMSSPAARRIAGGSAQKLASGSKLSLHTSAPLEIVVNNLNDAVVGDQSLSIFGGTPFKRSIESPSAWKSPWFMNSFLPGPRIETEITIEDIGYFMSPGDRSYDALGLMKHLSEHSAAAYANAQEVLGINTPEPITEKNSNDENPDQENQKPNQQTGCSSSLASNILIERRALDFSECGSPGKSKEKGRASSAVSFSSPSSYLLKGCR